MRGIVVGGTHSGCGKTTVTLGLMAALKKRGLSVQPFKAGPDYIDAGIQRLVADRPSRNLDLWMCGPDYVRKRFLRHSSGAGVSIIEGVMGLFDGPFSTASLAAVLDLPILLVVDGYGMAETAGALVRGMVAEAVKKGVRLEGVIFNRVASRDHFDRLRTSVAGVKVLGYLRRDPLFEISHRHLGLTTAEEGPIARENLEMLADEALEHTDMELFFGMMKEPSGADAAARRAALPLRTTGPVVAVAFDKAFSFYYEDNLELLGDSGASITRFSPLGDAAIPAGADMVYLGGGYPELYAAELAANVSMRRSVRDWVESGRPLYAECGGLMYLSRGIRDLEDNYFEMTGVFPFTTRMKKGRSRLGYREAELKEDCLIGRRGDRVRGHEFHYSEIEDVPVRMPGVRSVYRLHDGSGRDLPDEGYHYRNCLASYVHLHFGSNAGIVERLTDQGNRRN